MFTDEQCIDLLLNTLNEAVSMLLETCNVNKTEEEVLVLNNKQQNIIKNIHFIGKKTSNVKSNTTNKKLTRTMVENLVRSKILD
jgi:hypothetical protein